MKKCLIETLLNYGNQKLTEKSGTSEKIKYHSYLLQSSETYVCLELAEEHPTATVLVHELLNIKTFIIKAQLLYNFNTDLYRVQRGGCVSIRKSVKNFSGYF